MGREVDMEKEFSENIDRILAGQEVKVGAGMDDDCRMALDFAQKLIRLRAAPSPSFKAQLKERLLLKLSEEETKAPAGAKKNWLWEGLRHLVPHNVMWRAVTTTVLVIILAVGVLWGMGIFTELPAPAPLAPRGIPPAPSPPPRPWLEIEAIPLSPIAYAPAFSLEEEVKILFVFKNVSSEPITVAPFPPRIQIMRPRTDEVVRSFAEGSEQLDISPVETEEYTLVWDQTDDNGRQVVPGWYYVNVKDIAVSKATEPTTIGMGLWTMTKLLIQLPQGAMEKVIEVNQSQTVNGLTITLERVELSAMGARFCAFTIPPDYSPPQPQDSVPLPLPPPPAPMVPVHAQYTVDGVTKDAGYSGIGSRYNGIRLIWGYHEAWLDPVPSDAKELTFTITRFGDWQGPWEFFIPLEP